MYLCTPPNGDQYVTDCEESVLKRQVRLEPGFTYTEILYLPTANIKHILWEGRRRLLEEAETNGNLNIDRGKSKIKDALISAAIDELLTDF